MLSTGRSAYRDSIGPRPPCTRRRAMVTTSPRTALAGGVPTASPVLGDVVTIARLLVHGGRGPIESRYADLPVLSMADAVTRYQVRLRVADRPGVLAKVAQAFAANGVSIEAVQQSGSRGDHAVLLVVTHVAREAALSATVAMLDGLD